jgi:hypothetical protein
MLIPPWTDITDDTSDLLLGHEVGHALYTPADGWHDAVHNHDFPKSYANIVEDIRIEKKIQSKYPGLRSNFINGYKELLERDFFGISTKDVNIMSFMNRLNVKSKCRDLVQVNFTKEELGYVNKAYSCETFDDVINVCDEIYIWLKEKNEKAKGFNTPEPTSDETCENPAEEGNTEEVEEEVTQGGEGNDESETEEEEERETTTSESEGDNEDAGEEESEVEERESEEEESEVDPQASTIDDPDAEKAAEESEGGETGDFEESEEEVLDGDVDYTDASTDDEFRNKEDELVDANKDGGIAQVLHIPPIDKINKMIMPWRIAAELRQEKAKSMLSKVAHGHDSYFHSISAYFTPEREQQYVAANKSAIESANALVKEFERKKAAWETQRATESKRGSLNMVKLHQYKFSEDIFLSGLNKPNAKSHGIVSLMDFSGSMSKNMATTITQSYILALFCKKANIPFKCYSFTSGNIEGHNMILTAEDEFTMNGMLVVEQFSDDMPMVNIRQAFKSLFKAWNSLSFGYSVWAAACDNLGGTPLDSSLAVMIPVIDTFKKSNGLQKVTFVTITDGENAGDFLSGSYKTKKNLYYKNKQVFSNEGNSYTNPSTPKLLKAIQDMGVKTIGYYITAATPNDYSMAPKTPADAECWEERQLQWKTNKTLFDNARKAFRANQMVEWHKAGYDSYTFIKGDVGITFDNDEFFEDINSESKIGDLNKALKNMGKSKIFAQGFAKSFTNVFA